MTPNEALILRAQASLLEHEHWLALAESQRAALVENTERARVELAALGGEPAANLRAAAERMLEQPEAQAPDSQLVLNARVVREAVKQLRVAADHVERGAGVRS